jgi:ubiquinone biosynthesis protein
MFHADPHPGNIVVAADGSLILIDFGAVGRLSAGHRGSLAAMLVAASSGDAIALRRAVQEITVFDRRVEMSSLDEAIAEFLAEHMQAGKGITAASFQHLALMIGEFGIRLPRWFGTLTRTLVTLEGTLSGIDASFSLVDAAHEHAHQVAAPLASGPWREVVEREALAQAMQLRRIPGHVDEALEQLAAGRLTTRVAVFADPHEQRLLTRLVDRAVLALVASAVGIGSVLLLDVQAGPRLGSTISINEVLGYFGLTTSAVLVLRVVAGIIRDGEV